MKNLIKIIFLSALFLLITCPVMAEPVAENSAKIINVHANNLNNLRMVKKRIVLNKVLSRLNSPLQDSVDSFLNTCETYALDCYLLPSITGLESSFGVYTHPGSYNPFGWGGGYIMFNNWDQAINTVGKGLRENYINKGAETVYEIAPIYAESKTWAPRVSYFMTMFENEEAKIDLILQVNRVNL